MGDATSRIEQLLRERIESGEYSPGSQLPSERTLSSDLGVGRTTVRLVLGRLTAAGLIRPQHGRGYFVSGDSDLPTADELNRGEPDSLRWHSFGERTVYESRPWITVNLVDVQPPGGSERFEHHVVRLFRAAIGIVMDDDDRVLMLWRHRFVADQWGWELPGGIIDDGEDGPAAVAREIEEETGWRPNEIVPIISYQPMIGMVNSPHSLYFSRGATYIDQPADSDEAAEIEWIPLARVRELLDKNEILGSGSIIGLLHLLAFGPPQG